MIGESGVGLGFVALVIGYLPVLYQAFSRREVSVALLDSRAGSPPNAAELFRRHAFEGGQEALTALLAEWERWAAEILESHISYPILCYYRSQHDTQSWLSALVSILDTCSLMISVVEGDSSRQAQLTFVMARHALVDLGQVFRVKEKEAWRRQAEVDRLPPKDFYHLCEALGANHLQLCGDPAAAKRLNTIRALYEPHAYVLSRSISGCHCLCGLRLPKRTINGAFSRNCERTPSWRRRSGAALSRGMMNMFCSNTPPHPGVFGCKLTLIQYLRANIVCKNNQMKGLCTNTGGLNGQTQHSAQTHIH